MEKIEQVKQILNKYSAEDSCTHDYDRAELDTRTAQQIDTLYQPEKPEDSPKTRNGQSSRVDTTSPDLSAYLLTDEEICKATGYFKLSEHGKQEYEAVTKAQLAKPELVEAWKAMEAEIISLRYLGQSLLEDKKLLQYQLQQLKLEIEELKKQFDTADKALASMVLNNGLPIGKSKEYEGENERD